MNKTCRNDLLVMELIFWKNPKANGQIREPWGDAGQDTETN